MNSSRFDHVATHVRRLPRRQALLALAGAVFGLAAHQEHTSARCGAIDAGCSKKKKCCAGTICQAKRCATASVPCDGRSTPCLIDPWNYQTHAHVLTVYAGSTVRWVGDAGNHPVIWLARNGGEIDALSDQSAQEAVLSTPGSYPYRCRPHAQMTGTVYVIPAP